MSSTNNNEVVGNVEDSAHRLVQLIRAFIDQLRSIKEPSLAQKLRQQKQGSDKLPNDSVAHPPPCLREIESQLHSLNRDMEARVPILDDAGLWDLSSSDNNGTTAQTEGEAWTKVVLNIVFPLLAKLGKCYAFLDRLPSAPPTTHEKNDEKVNQNHDLSTNRRRQQPRPPSGMLSLQNYTDIATLLEFTVCVCVLPFLEKNVLPPLTHRLKLIPKSLRGRMPLLALKSGWSQRQSHGRDNKSQSQQDMILAATLVGNLVHLERFRPMLLPRHLADLYAALFQLEQRATIVEGNSDTPPPPQAFHRLRFHLLDDPDEMFLCANLRARAFQTLLLQGREAPLWLRQRVSGLLNHLATTRLEAVLEVFVHSAPTNTSAAALRLSQALTLIQRDDSSDKMLYWNRLAHQLLVVLDSTILRSDSSKDTVITIQAVWMILDQLPNSIVQQTFGESFAHSFLPHAGSSSSSVVVADPGEAEVSIHRTVLRLERLLSAAPLTVNRERFCRLVLLRPLKDIPGDRDDEMGDFVSIPEATLFGLLLRLACAPTVVQSAAKNDAKIAFRAAVDFMATAFSRSNGNQGSPAAAADGVDVAVVAWVKALVPSKWDLVPMGFRFPTILTDSNESGVISAVFAEKDNPTARKRALEENVGFIERCATFSFRDIIASLCKEEEFKSLPSSDASPDLPSRMLEYLVVLFLRSEQQHSESSFALQLTAMVAIPILCENCPLEALVSGANGNFRLLQLMRSVFDLLAKPATNNNSSRGDNAAGSFKNAETFVSRMMNKSDKPSDRRPSACLPADASFGMSIAAVLLNILACALELGATKRSSAEESELQGLMSSLEGLATVGSIERSGGDAQQRAEISEAASHILALIGSRRGAPAHLDDMSSKVEQSTLSESLRRAEQDLISDEPPLRARGVSLLRLLIMSVELTVPQDETKMSLVSEVGGEEKDDAAARQRQIFVLLLQALADAESYVYLAAIHAMALLVQSSQTLFRTVLIGIASGNVSLEGEDSSEVLQDQRVKLTEVAIAVLRRSPAMLHHMSAAALDQLLWNSTAETRSTQAGNAEFHKRTHEFFERVDNENTGNEQNDWKEKRMRINTGGPIFSSEESDLVRSALISLSSEIVDLQQPAKTAPRCFGLMECASKCLTCESARPIVRSGSLLATSLYSAAVREMEQLLESPGADCPLNIAMAEAEEQAFAAILLQIAHGRCFSAKTPDPATIARCEEALVLRERLESQGMLAAAHISIEKTDAKDEFLVKLLSQKDNPQ